MKQTRMFILILLFLFVFVLAACGKQKQEKEETKPEGTKQYMENLFEQLPEEFLFSSVEGTWSTTLQIGEDGSFVGR